jgi:hypothetical protein
LPGSGFLLFKPADDLKSLALAVALNGIALLLKGNTLLALFGCGYAHVSKELIHE